MNNDKISFSNITGNSTLKALISILFFTLANISFAEDMRYYDIEIIIFENLSEEAKNSENWPRQVNLVQPEKTVQLGQPVVSDWLPVGVDLKSSYKVLNASTYQLNDKVEAISKSKTQRVIFHTAWRQPGLDKNQALPIYFKREIATAPVIQDEKTQNAEGTSSSDTNELAVSPSILEGIIRVTLARYLHLEAEISYRDKLPAILNSDNPFSMLDNENERAKVQKQGVIHFKQDRRRIRSNELHYLDHPVLGMLVNITPYEKAEDTAKK